MVSGTIKEGYLPEANKGHLVAIVEFDCRGRHAGV